MSDSSSIEADRRGWRSAEAEWLDLLTRLVETSSHSDDVEGIDRERRLLRPVLEGLGLEVDVLPVPPDLPRPRAKHLLGRWRRPGRPRVLLIGHLDTVFPRGEGACELRREGELLHGPGVGDIKGGVVAMLAALDLLRRRGLDEALDVALFLGSDEEVGSHASRDLLRELSADRDHALGFEPAFHLPGESVLRHSSVQHVVERKGCGRFAVRLSGTAAHSGSAHHQGASAIEALARKVQEAHALTDRDRGVTVNVGLVAGGRSVNTVAPWASAEVDFRFRDAADGETTAATLRALLQRAEEVSTEHAPPVSAMLEPGGGVLWPPLVPSDASRALSALVIEASAEHGVRAEGVARGGASDACHSAAVGVPSICGLGPVTSGIHTDAEHTSVAALRASALVAARVLERIAEGALR